MSRQSKFTPDEVKARYEKNPDRYWELLGQSIKVVSGGPITDELKADDPSINYEAVLWVAAATLLDYFVLSQTEFADELVQARFSERARAAALQRVSLDKDGKAAAMAAIRAEWKKRKDAGLKFKAVEFAREMHRRPEFRIVTLEAIKNAQTRWGREYHPASMMTPSRQKDA